MKRIPLYVLAILGAVLFSIPLVWTVSTALKTRQQVNAVPPEWVPKTYAIDVAGERVPVNVVARIAGPASVVRLKAGTRAGELIPVSEGSIVPGPGAALAVRLKVPEPVPAERVRAFEKGLVQVRLQAREGGPASRPADVGQDALVAGADWYVPPERLVPVFDPQWRNFAQAWNSYDHGGTLPYPFHRFVLNTFTITILNIIGQVLSCSLVAYGFARFKFRGKNVLFLLLLSTLMLPPQVTMIPVFLIWDGAGLIDTFAPLTIPAYFATSAFSVFLLRQFFMTLPRELDEAAMIDGCGPFRIWWQIVMPLSKPALTTVAVLAFIGHWDDFMGPLIYLNSPSNYTVSLALRMFQDQNGSEFNLLMAAALIHLVPVLVLFLVAQRYFVKGIATTGLKA